MSICRWSVISLRVLLCPVFMLISALNESVMMAALGGLLSIIQCSACCIAISSAVYIDRCSSSLYFCVCLRLGIVNAQPTCLLFISLLPSVYICKWCVCICLLSVCCCVCLLILFIDFVIQACFACRALDVC